jgi:phenylpropionate dioxygenase-like ring-hydroxylating dioxygenase large terminal subunit
MTEHRGDHRGFPFSTRPTGWFQLGWSAEFPVGVPRPLKYFGRELVAYRGASGQVHLFDAYCPHFGAHLGHGGTVVEDDIVCPFHGWRFNRDGENVDIPYSERRRMPKSLTCWHVQEIHDVVYFWHDANGYPPQWDIEPPIAEPAEYYPLYPHGTRTWKLRLYPQFVTENGVDFSHFVYAHKAAFAPRLEWHQEVSRHVFHAQTRGDLRRPRREDVAHSGRPRHRSPAGRVPGRGAQHRPVPRYGRGRVARRNHADRRRLLPLLDVELGSTDPR